MIRAIPAIFLLLVVAACTGGSNDEIVEAPTDAVPTTLTPPKDTVPEPLGSCASIWKDGKTLPKDYTGCGAPEGSLASNVEQCDDDSSFATYIKVDGDKQTPYFARLGGKIVEYNDDDFGPYTVELKKCQG